MFEGRTHKQVGDGARSIRFAYADCGVATTTYSYKLNDDERAAMARRITAALNLTRLLSIEQLENSAPIGAPKQQGKNVDDSNEFASD